MKPKTVHIIGTVDAFRQALEDRLLRAGASITDDNDAADITISMGEEVSADISIVYSDSEHTEARLIVKVHDLLVPEGAQSLFMSGLIGSWEVPRESPAPISHDIGYMSEMQLMPSRFLFCLRRYHQEQSIYAAEDHGHANRSSRKYHYYGGASQMLFSTSIQSHRLLVAIAQYPRTRFRQQGRT